MKVTTVGDTCERMNAILVHAQVNNQTRDCTDDLAVQHSNDLSFREQLQVLTQLPRVPNDVLFKRRREAQPIQRNHCVNVVHGRRSQFKLLEMLHDVPSNPTKGGWLALLHLCQSIRGLSLMSQLSHWIVTHPIPCLICAALAERLANVAHIPA